MNLLNKHVILFLGMFVFFISYLGSNGTNSGLDGRTTAVFATTINNVDVPTGVPETTLTFLPIVARSPVFNTVHPTKLTEKYIPNPYMGWQNTRNDSQRFPATTLYDRFQWAYMNPQRNVYDWNELEILRQDALDSGQQMHFRIRNAQPPPWGPGHLVPQWVIEDGAVIVNGAQGTEPLYSNCQFLDAHGIFVDALRQQYDGDPAIAMIDIGSYGNYGEWDTEQYDENPNSLDWHARRRLADMYIGGDGLRPCQQADGTVVNTYYDYEGFQETQLLMPYTPWRKDTLFYVLNKRSDVGIRHDSLGSQIHQDKYREEIGALVEMTWRNAPIVFEFSPNADSAQGLNRARAFAQEMHASLVHQNFSGRDAGVESVLEVVGFKLVLNQMTYVSELEPQIPFTMMMQWENLGSAVPYHPYPLMVYLLDVQGDVVWEREIATDVRTWEPETVVQIVEDFPFPTAVDAGVYDLRLAFVDPDSQMPVLNLAIAGKDANGRYHIGSVQVP